MEPTLNNEAWAILTEDEQLAVSLKLGYNKSSWKAGEIVGRAHYKFLEIEARAKHFLKIFTEHFEVYDELIPGYVPMNKQVREYFRLTMVKRYSVGDAVEKIGIRDFARANLRNELIIKTLERMVNSKSVIDKSIATMIFEFDRWNNFRILPRDIQEPSAFKRRNKNYDIRNIKNLLSISPFSWKIVLKRCKASPGQKVIYMPMFTNHDLGEDSPIVPIKYTVENVSELSKIGLFLFTREERAKEFYELVKEYDVQTRGKSCVYGQQFWPKFRKSVKDALNYNAIRKRIPSRKFLESALKDIDAQLLNPQKDELYSSMKR